MAEVRKKPATKRAAPKKAAKKVEAKAVEAAPEKAPSNGKAAEQSPALVSPDLAEMISKAVAAGIQQGIAAVQAHTAEPSIEGDEVQQGPPSGMMTTYTRSEQEEEDLEVLTLTDPIGAQLARADATPGGKRVEADILNTPSLTREQLENMTDEQIATYNANEMRKMQARKAKQVVNRAELEGMTRAERIAALSAERDPSVIREADNPLGERMIQCVTTHRIGLGQQGTSDIDETIKVPLSAARSLQDAGRIKVRI